MNAKLSVVMAALIGGIAGFTGGAANAAPPQPVMHNVTDMKFGTIPRFPTCATASIEQGDPASEPILVLVKMERNCSFPWHWHTPNEYAMIVKGEGYLEMKDGKKAQTLRAGGFGALPSKHIHQFQCTSKSCLLYVHADSGPFDIHYVDPQGKEIEPDEALKAVKQTAAK